MFTRLQRYRHNPASRILPLTIFCIGAWVPGCQAHPHGAQPDGAAPPPIIFVQLGPAVYQRGSTCDDPFRLLDERPHTVHLTHRFEIAATEVTFAQWEAMGYWNLGNHGYIEACGDPDCPVDLDDGYLELLYDWLDDLSMRHGLTPCYFNRDDFLSPYHCPGYRLPTEAEWEYAARGDDPRMTYNGNFDEDTVAEVLDDIAWCGGSYDDHPQPVARKRETESSNGSRRA